MITTTKEQNARVRAAFNGCDTHPFSEWELDAVNVEDLHKWVDDHDMVGLVDESCAGIVGYVSRTHASRIAGLLNAAAVDADGLPAGVLKLSDTPVAGGTWKGTVLGDYYRVLGDSREELVMCGGKYRTFAGHLAERLSDRRLALVALTKKPDVYPYDSVLL